MKSKDRKLLSTISKGTKVIYKIRDQGNQSTLICMHPMFTVQSRHLLGGQTASKLELSMHSIIVTLNSINSSKSVPCLRNYASKNISNYGTRPAFVLHSLTTFSYCQLLSSVCSYYYVINTKQTSST